MAAAAADREERDDGMVDKLVHINRVAKVVKGGGARLLQHSSSSAIARRAASASATARREVPEAIRKATESPSAT
jgi:small subunit ribosomal protein S5